MNKEEQDIIVFLEISAITKAKKTIISKEDVKCFLNLIDKLQKELDNSISKDKIKEALGDENIPDEMILTYIETLVSENNRLEDIEDRKVQIEYNNVFNKGVRSVEDKIRTKIEKIKKEMKTENYIVSLYAIGILEELLGDDE